MSASVGSALSLLANASRVSPPLRDAVAAVEDEIDHLRDEIALLAAVAHQAWHLTDESGEVPETTEILCPRSQFDRLSAALDKLEATGWHGCPA